MKQIPKLHFTKAGRIVLLSFLTLLFFIMSILLVTSAYAQTGAKDSDWTPTIEWDISLQLEDA